MNAILVFDPSNDLVFVKSNKLFRTRVLRYSKLQGLIAGADGPLTSDSATAASSSSSSSQPSSQSGSPCSEMSTGAGQSPRNMVLKRQRRRRRARASSINDHLLNASNGQLDTNKKYLEILMLLLTPYVASLRLSGLIRQQQRAALKSLSPSSSANSAAASSSSSQRKSSGGDLLSKFMSSIQVNHETRIDDATTRNRTEDNDDDNVYDDDDGNDTGKAHHEFTPRRFSQFQMPIECLSDCQIVYCELFDFIFIHMQQLEQVSSFKMRLLQKRIDLFARLALLLFGPSFNSMRNSPNTNGNGNRQQVDQGRILRQVYDVWLEYQFEPQFLLEANERLMVGKSIEQHCQDALRKLSIHLRLCSSQGETHMHALLYSDTKLTYNIYHNNELHDDDEDDANDDVRSGRRRPPMAQSAALTPTYCYNSNFNTNRRTSEIYPTPSSSSPTSLSMGSLSARSGPMQRHHRQQLRRSRASCSPSESQMSSEAPSGSIGDHKLPSQFLIFLSTPGKFKDRLRVPHMLRLVPLARGVTLIIISEISTSYLSLQLNRVLKILLELTDPVASSGEAATGPTLPLPPPAAITKAPSVSSWRAAAPTTTSLSKLQQQQQQSSGCLVKLSQLAKINDCVCAIKSYFNGQNYDLIDHHQHSVVGGQPLGLNFSVRSEQQHSRCAPGRGLQATSASLASGGSDCATGAARQRRRQSNLVNLFSRWYSGSGSNKSTVADQTKAGAKGQAGIETESFEPDFGSNPGCCRGEPAAAVAVKTVYEMLDERARRQCCQLVCRLEDLVSSNMHTYMRRTFNLPVEERKRQALLNNVALVLRESLDTFVFQPQLRLLNDRLGPYMRLHSELVDQVRLIAGEHLSDYLDYLAVKATCNVTLGAPLTDDMPALRSFIYVDRCRQEMFVSPMRRNLSKMNRDSVLEVDFRSAIASNSMRPSSNGLSSEFSSESDGCSSAERNSSEADESSSVSSSGSIESVIYRPSLNDCNATNGAQFSTQSNNKTQKPVASNRPENINSRRAKSQWLIGTSGDLVTTNEFCSSSGHSSSLTNMTSSFQSNIGSHHQNSRRGGGFNQNSCEDYMDDLARAASSPSVHLVDETLVKGFTCFIYNRLAKGKTSFTSNDGTYVYSYFLWFKHSNKVVELEPGRKLAVAKNLELNYRSMPSVVCGDFFNNYGRILFGYESRNKLDSYKPKSKRPHKLVEVACQISELDANSGNRLVRRRLSQLKDMKDEDEDSDDLDMDEPGEHLNENDFGLFLRNQAAPKTNRVPRFTIERQTGSTKSLTGTIDKVKVKRAETRNGAQCYELFCVHQATLLVHRRQVLVEAERLAQRLAQLCSSD